MKRKGEAIAWVIAYDYPFSHCAEQAGINMILDFIDEDDFSITNKNQRIILVSHRFAKECVGNIVDTSIGGYRVARKLDRIVEFRSKPKAIVCDNRPEFTSGKMFDWSQKNGIDMSFIQSGKPQQNAFVESFNDRMRDECLNVNGKTEEVKKCLLLK